MKKSWQHHYNKVTVPCFVGLHEVADFMTDDDYELVSRSVERIGFTVTIEDEPADETCGDPGGRRIIDWDMMPLGVENILYADILIQAVESFVYDMEETIVKGKAADKAFESFYSEREIARENAIMEKHFETVNK